MVLLDDDDDGKLANWQTSGLVTPGETLENPGKTLMSALSVGTYCGMG